MIILSDYCLPDVALLNDDATQTFLVWQPDKPYIVLGASNRPEDALYIENILQDDITVMKRPSGGQTVMLTPGNLVIAGVFPHSLQPKNLFNAINSLIISVLEETGVGTLSLRGISDIAIDGKKILGSAMYRNREKLLYHAVLNVSEPAATFEKYLRHPGKEPDYREGRTHADFVTSLWEQGYAGTAGSLTVSIIRYLRCLM
jgi:lipoate---protein ligase